MARTLWAKWKRFAHRAAEIQSLVILSALYWIVMVPIGLLRRRTRGGGPPHWTTREPPGEIGLDRARRQS